MSGGNVGLRCPHCGSVRLTTKDSRKAKDTIRRRRVCFDCGKRFTTAERVVKP